MVTQTPEAQSLSQYLVNSSHRRDLLLNGYDARRHFEIGAAVTGCGRTATGQLESVSAFPDDHPSDRVTGRRGYYVRPAGAGQASPPDGQRRSGAAETATVVPQS